MSQEEDIKQEIAKRFSGLADKIRIPRPRRLYIEIDLANFKPLFECAAKELGFSHLLSITGLDEGENLSFIYHLAKDGGMVLNLKTSVSKNNPAIDTVTSYFPGAEIYERELIDLFGAKVQGLPAGNRYPLTDDWPKDQYPLRKDWKPNQGK